MLSRCQPVSRGDGEDLLCGSLQAPKWECFPPKMIFIFYLGAGLVMTCDPFSPLWAPGLNMKVSSSISAARSLHPSCSCQVIPGNPFAYHSGFIIRVSAHSSSSPFFFFSFFLFLPFLLPLEIFLTVILGIHLEGMFAILQLQVHCTAEEGPLSVSGPSYRKTCKSRFHFFFLFWKPT